MESGISDNGGEEFAEFGEVAELSGHISNLTSGVRHVWGDFIEFIIQIQIICLSALVGTVGDLRRFLLILIHLESCASAQQSKACGGGAEFSGGDFFH